MKNEYKKYSLTAIISTTCLVPLGNFAIAAVPSCESLGYNMAPANCSGEAVKCPFDSSKVYCVRKAGTKTCTESSCTSTPVTSAQSCDTMGYSFAAADCASGYVKCPFDISKVYCIKKVVQKTCTDYGYLLTQPTGKYCESISIDSIDCMTNCKTDYCERYSGTYSAPPVKKNCQPRTINGMSCYYNCTDKPNTCEGNGYYVTEPSGKYCTSVSLDDGTICYDPTTCKNSSSGGGTTTPAPLTEAQCRAKYSSYVNNYCGNNCHASSDYMDSRIPAECRFSSLMSCECSSWH
ncbi:MAG: hypothetical protein ACK5N8_00910 [Alphaproteobacteria bacterium]